MLLFIEIHRLSPLVYLTANSRLVLFQKYALKVLKQLFSLSRSQQVESQADFLWISNVVAFLKVNSIEDIFDLVLAEKAPELVFHTFLHVQVEVSHTKHLLHPNVLGLARYLGLVRGAHTLLNEAKAASLVVS